jgi:hypothetical protein
VGGIQRQQPGLIDQTTRLCDALVPNRTKPRNVCPAWLGVRVAGAVGYPVDADASPQQLRTPATRSAAARC